MYPHSQCGEVQIVWPDRKMGKYRIQMVDVELAEIEVDIVTITNEKDIII